jgi:flavin-dependent dehydrogenase
MKSEVTTRASLSRQSDAAVVGASAAGLYTAYLLARGGISVDVLEQAKSLAPEPRTLIVTRRLRGLLGSLAERAVVNEIRRFELFTDGRATQVTLDRPDLIVERSQLIQSLAESAASAGARFRLGRQFRSLKISGNGLTVSAEKASGNGAQALTERFDADIVIGGDGAASRVAHAAGWPSQETVPLVQAIVPLPKDMAPDTVRVWFVPQDTPYFYWLIPESPERGALGLIGETGPGVRAHLDRFLEKRRLYPISFQAARIPVYRRWTPVEKCMGRGRVFLVGDAAGQVKVTTIGGIVTGFRGALGVAEAILQGKSRELDSLRRELDLHLFLRRGLHRFTQSDYSHLVDLLNSSSRRSLGRYSRDEALRLLWHIGLRQPRLLLMGLRGVLMNGSLDRRAETTP